MHGRCLSKSNESTNSIVGPAGGSCTWRTSCGYMLTRDSTI